MHVEPGRIYKGDNRILFEKIADATVDLGVIDPPYNIGYEYDVHKDDMPPRDYEAFMTYVMSEYFRTLKPDGALWLIIGDEWACELKVAASKLGFRVRNWVVWHYTFGVNTPTKFTRSHAHCFHFVKNPKPGGHCWHPEKVPSMRQLVYNDNRAKAGGRNPDDTWILNPRWLPDGFAEHHDTWYVPRLCGTFKEKRDTPNQLPEQLVARIITATSDVGDIVLDAFAGSGTVPIVAKKLGRVPFGFELSERYQKQAQAALDAVGVGQAIA